MRKIGCGSSLPVKFIPIRESFRRISKTTFSCKSVHLKIPKPATDTAFAEEAVFQSPYFGAVLKAEKYSAIHLPCSRGSECPCSKGCNKSKVFIRHCVPFQVSKVHFRAPCFFAIVRGFPDRMLRCGGR